MKVIKIGCMSISFVGLIQTILIILKVIGYNISWWIVFIPTLIYIGLIMVLLIIIFTFTLWSKELE